MHIYGFVCLLIPFMILVLTVPVVLKGEEIRENIIIPDTCVTASRSEKEPLYVPATVYSLSSEALTAERMVRTVPEAFMEVPGVMVQKTSQGQGSPYIRGFTGYRTLFLVDGIRLNNSTFRDGPNQYWNTVDLYSIGNMEVVKGPGSVLYGSDAVGGTVNAMTIGPDFDGQGCTSHGRLYGRYSSGEQSGTVRVQAGGNYDTLLGLVAGFTWKDFGNVIGGHVVGEQSKTGYDEWDGDIKLEYRPAADRKIVLVHQRVDLDDAWRTHKTIYGIDWKGTTHGSEKDRILDQDRNLSYIQYFQDDFSWLENIILSLSFQEQKENRHRTKRSDVSEKEGTYVGTTGLWGQAGTETPAGMFTYGFDYYHDSVTSYKRKYNSGGTLNRQYIQGPVADDATYDLLGAYIQDDIFFGNSFELMAGGRFTYAHAGAGKVQDPVTGNRISVNNHWTAFTGSIQGIYLLDQQGHYSIYSSIAQAFRAPNLSDLTRFDSARSDEFEIPAPDLEPERYITYEIGFKAKFDNFSSQVSYFYTNINDMIIRTPTGTVNADGEHEVTKKNAGDGYVNGVELDVLWEFYPGFQAHAAFSWMYGEVDTYPASTSRKEREPLDRLMPLTCQGGIRWKPAPDYWIEGVVIHADRQDELSTRDKSDTDRIPPGGTPSYTVLTLRGAWNITPYAALSCAIENMADVDYRIHGSGVNEPGLNAVVVLDLKF